MRRRKQKKVNLSFFMIGVVLVVILLVLISITNMLRKKATVSKNASTNIYVENAIDLQNKAKDTEMEKLKSMTERARIEYYITKFINYIELEDYDSAYELLNVQYKKNYFSSQKSFREYCENNFYTMMDIKYNNFERNGDVYVSWVQITDAINGEKDSGKEINFVVKENGFNDFEISFSAN